MKMYVRSEGWRHTWTGTTVHLFRAHPLNRAYEYSRCGLTLPGQHLWSERTLPRCKRCEQKRFLS